MVRITFILFLVAPAVQAWQPSFSVADILSSPMPSSLTVDSAGKRLAWVADSRGVRNIWVAEAPGFGPRRLTDYDQDDGVGLRILGITHDGAKVVYIRDGRFNAASNPAGAPGREMLQIDFRGGEPDVVAAQGSGVLSPTTAEVAYSKGSSIFIAKLEGEEEAEKVLSLRGNPGSLTFSPDGRKLVFDLRRESLDINYAFIALYDRDKKNLTYIDASVYGDYGPVFSPDGTRIAFVRQLKHQRDYVLSAKVWPVPNPWEIRVHDLKSGKTEAVWRSPDHDTLAFAELEWMSDEHLAFISEQNGWRNLYGIPAKGGKVIDLAVGEFIVEAIAVKPEQGKIWYVANADDINRRHIWSVDTRGKRERLTGDGIQWSPRPLANGLAWLGSDATQPATVFVRTKKKPKMLVKPPEEFPTDRLVVPVEVTFRAGDGWEIHGQLFLPPEKFTGKRPTLMFFHGGPIRQMLPGFHYSGYYHNCYALNQHLAARGYVVLAVNFRLGVGYGRAFRDVPDGGPRGASEYRDLLAGARFLRKHDRVDPDRMGLWGGSYGGYMTALGLARNSDLFAAGVDFHGVHDWNQWQSYVRREENDHDRTEWAASPVADLSNWSSPVLLIHGDDDRNVNFSETIWLAKDLKAQGVEVELLVIPDDVHSFLLHRNWVRAFEATADFFDRKLGNR
ncbi:MAG: prolyl oligopeptidase family serine peptidase [Acidobacteriota bacterium]|nr:prolyl oligopeptidase family serine peptidase [Acidobacteriota bacterium]